MSETASNTKTENPSQLIEKMLDALSSIQNSLSNVERFGSRDKLMTLDDVAEFFTYNKNYTQRVVITHPTFPAPIILPTGSLRGSKRWVAKEVIAWANRFKLPRR